jgi:hypothetical protein
MYFPTESALFPFPLELLVDDGFGVAVEGFEVLADDFRIESEVEGFELLADGFCAEAEGLEFDGFELLADDLCVEVEVEGFEAEAFEVLAGVFCVETEVEAFEALEGCFCVELEVEGFEVLTDTGFCGETEVDGFAIAVFELEGSEELGDELEADCFAPAVAVVCVPCISFTDGTSVVYGGGGPLLLGAATFAAFNFSSSRLAFSSFP